MGDIKLAVESQEIYGPLVVFPGDTVFTYNIKKFFYEIKRKPETGWLALRKEMNETERRKYGVVGMDADGVITSFVEKPESSIEENVFKGPCYFPPTLTARIGGYCADIKGRSDIPDNIGSFISWALGEIKFKGCVMHSGECIDVGSYSDYRSASGRVRRSLGEDGEGYLF